jgi:ribA/ribD-fused uncharacterized protein
MKPAGICFYTTKDEHGYMSNFSRYELECFGRKWMTSEHCYQAQKFVGMNVEDYDAVFNADRPMVAAALGRDPNRPIRPDWEAVRDDVMRFVVYHKFSQNTQIRDKLLLTGDVPLFEHDTKRGDRYWAIDKKGIGKNMLGVILMEVREVLREDLAAYEQRASEMNDCIDCKLVSKPVCAMHCDFTRTSDIYLASLKF